MVTIKENDYLVNFWAIVIDGRETEINYNTRKKAQDMADYLNSRRSEK